jgi:hypothetical protein
MRSVSGIHILLRAPWETSERTYLAPSGDHFWHFAHERYQGPPDDSGEGPVLLWQTPAGYSPLPLVPAVYRDDVPRGFFGMEPLVLKAVIAELDHRPRYSRIATYFQGMSFPSFAWWHHDVARRVLEMMEAGEVLAAWDEADSMRQRRWQALETEYRGRIGGRRRGPERNPFAIVRTHGP